MKKHIKKILLPLLFVSFFGGIVGATVPSQTSAACTKNFLTFPAWYKGLINDSTCELKKPGNGSGAVPLDKYIWIIVLNIIEILLQIIGYAAIFMIIYAGFMYMTNGSSPQATADAIKTIINASVGIVIALSAIAIKNFVWELFTGGTNEYGIYTGISTQELLNSGLQKVYFIAGAIAVLVIIVSGLRFTTSAGGSDGVAKSRRMLTGAVIGLVIVIAASAITKFILTRFS